MSDYLHLKCGVPQGSVLGPIMFILLTTSLRRMLNKYNVFYHKYADDIQLYVIFDPSVPGDREQVNRRMEACVKEIRLWMASRWLKLNDDKTEMAIFMSAHHQKTYGQCDITIGESTILPAYHVRNLGVEMDRHLSMSHQVSAICKSCNFHLYRLSSIRRYLTVKSHTECCSSPHNISA